MEDYILCKNVLAPLKTNAEKNQALLDLDADPDTKEALYKYFVCNDSGWAGKLEKINNFKAVGLDMDDFLTASVEYARINKELDNLQKGKATAKANAFSRWLDTQDVNPKQHAVAMDTFLNTFRSRPQNLKRTTVIRSIYLIRPKLPMVIFPKSE